MEWQGLEVKGRRKRKDGAKRLPWSLWHGVGVGASGFKVLLSDGKFGFEDKKLEESSRTAGMHNSHCLRMLPPVRVYSPRSWEMILWRKREYQAAERWWVKT